jgi:hypothetical protein
VLFHPYFRHELGQARVAARLRRAERDRLVCRTATRPMRAAFTRLAARLRALAGTRAAGRVPGEVRIRFATEQDRRTWPDLRTDAPEHVLVADVDGAPRAALSLLDGAVVWVAERGRATPRPGADTEWRA